MRRALAAGEALSHYFFGDPYTTLQLLNLAFFLAGLAMRLAALVRGLQGF